MAQGGTKYSCLISIHALLAESDGESVVKIVEQWAFLSTLSLRRATQQRGCFTSQLLISIHALLAESDEESKATVWHDAQISIHALLAESDHLRCMLFGYNP